MGKGERTRREIVERALVLAGDVGLENVTLGTLATELGLSKSGLFAHFKSKETLQLAVLSEAVERFVALVVRPAIAAPRGEPRVVAFFERWLAWIRDEHGGYVPPAAATARDASGNVGGGGGGAAGRCIFLALAQEYDDRPGPVRDAVVRSQQDWRASIARAARLAIAEGHFRADLDVEQFAFELLGIGMTFQHTLKLLADPRAEERARTAFGALLARARRARDGRTAGGRAAAGPETTNARSS